MKAHEILIGEDFCLCQDEPGRIWLSVAGSDEVLIELPTGLPLTETHLEAIGQSALLGQRNAYAAGHSRGLADKSAEIPAVLGLIPSTES